MFDASDRHQPGPFHRELSDGRHVALGRAAVHHDRRLPLLHNYLNLAQLPPLQPKVDNSTRAKWLLGHNDALGDCVQVGRCNHVLVAAALSSQTVNLTDDDAVTAYEQLCGYQPGNTDSDQGCVELDTLNKWTQGAPLGGVSLEAFAGVAPQNPDFATIRYAIQVFGSCYIGLNMPAAWQESTGSGRVWGIGPNVDPNYQAGSWGGHCIVPGMRVLTDDLRWVPVESLNVGDALVGFDEYPAGRPKRQYRRSIVEATAIFDLPCYDLEFSDGSRVRCSEDHQWLAGGPGDTLHWMRTDRLQLGERASRIAKPLSVWEPDLSRDAGYLAAAFDGEGWLDGESRRAIHKAGFAQRDNEMLDHVRTALAERGVAVRERIHSTSGFSGLPIREVVVNTSKANLARFLGTVRPHRLLPKFTADRFGEFQSDHVRLVSKTPCGIQTVIGLQTSTRTYLMEGFAAHNCVILVGYDWTGATPMFTAITWAQAQLISRDAMLSYCDERYALLTNLWRQHVPEEAIAFDQLSADLQAIRSS